jgi:uncharacterized protein (TIGR03435 family)
MDWSLLFHLSPPRSVARPQSHFTRIPYRRPLLTSQQQHTESRPRKWMSPVMCLSIAVLASCAMFGQAPTGTPAFEVASVRAHDPNVRRGVDFRVYPGGRLSISNLELVYIIERAYGLQHYQIEGGPGWLYADTFDIDAKADGAPSQDRVMQMLRTLLSDRFHLRVHRVKKDGPAYSLVIAKGGPKLRQAKGAATPWVGSGRTGAASDDEPAVSYFVEGEHASMSLLAERLPLRVPVSDRTGVRGYFDFKFEYDADPTQSDKGPAIDAAMQKALGLRLEKTRVPIDILVIDHVEKSSKD